MKVRWLKVVPIVALAAFLPACFFIGRNLPAPDAQTEPAPAVPDIELWLSGSGGDAIDVFWQASGAQRLALAEGVAHWLGSEVPIASDNELFPSTASVQLDGRLAVEQGADWVLDLDTAGLTPVLKGANLAEATLVICTPKVEPVFSGDRRPDLSFEDVVCDADGRGWHIDAADFSFSLRVRMRPDPGDYLTYAAAVLLGLVLFGALALWVGHRLRRGPFRQRNAASVAIGLVAGGFLCAGLAGTVVSAGAASGAADNLAMARDLTLGGEVSSVAFLALIATAPGIVFATLLCRRRPWDEESLSPSAPPPPGEPPGVAPPPLPWEAR